MTKPLTPYQRIMRAADKGVGVRLSAAECLSMSIDNAIFRLADNDDWDALDETAADEARFFNQE